MAYPLTKDQMISFARKQGLSLGDYDRKTVAQIWEIIVANGMEEAARKAGGEEATVKETAKAVAVAASGDAAGDLAKILRQIMGSQLDEDRVRAIVGEHTAAAIKAAVDNMPPRRFEFVKEDGTTTTIEGRQHKMFERLVRYLRCKGKNGQRLNVWLTGPAGSGKTTAAKNAAQLLGLPFYFNGSIDTEYKLLGFSDANSRVVRTPFREAWEHGGVYLFDEIDGSLPPAILAVNAALAGNLCAFPDGIVEKHPDCVIIAAANTWGHGATMEFVGRMKLDAASLDRFIKLAWDIDEELELEIMPNRKWTEYVQKVRAKARERGLKVIISPRASMFGAMALEAGDSWEEAAMATMGFGLAPEQWQAIK